MSLGEDTMGRYLLKRLLATLPVLFLTSLVIFASCGCCRVTR